MKKLFIALFLFAALAAKAQTAYTAVTRNITAVAAYCSNANKCNVIGTGAAFHQLSWNVSGTLSACSVSVDSSADGITWGSGDIIAAQTCTSNGQTISTSHVVNYVRVNVTAITPVSTATLTVQLSGFANLPSGGGSVTSIATTSPISGGTITTTGTLSCPTCVVGPPVAIVGTENVYNSGSSSVVGNGLVNGYVGAPGDTLPTTASGSSQFDVANTTTVIAPTDRIFVGSSIGFQANMSGNYVGSFGPYYAALDVSAITPAANTFKLSDLFGIRVNTVHQGSGVMNDLLAGGIFTLSKSGSGNVTNVATTIYATGTVSGAGTITEAAGLETGMAPVAGAGTITNNYGLRILGSSFFGGGTLTHNYGLFINDQTGGSSTTNSDPWSIWTNGGKHHFGSSVEIAGHLNQTVTKQFAGTCAMAAGTSCTFTLVAAYTSTPVCVATAQGTNVTGGAVACSVSGTTVTITAASSNSNTWGAVLVGNVN